MTARGARGTYFGNTPLWGHYPKLQAARERSSRKSIEYFWPREREEKKNKKKNKKNKGSPNNF
jgi:hypothetical protein